MKNKSLQLGKKEISTKKANFSAKQGFSLIEVLIALLILSVGLVMVAALMTSNLKSSMNSRNQIIASELAQEGLELVQNKMDNAYAFGVGGDKYIIGYDGAISGPNTTSESQILNVNAGGFYSHNAGGTATKYRRKIDIRQSVSDPNQYNITVMVNWKNEDFPAVATDCTIANKCLSAATVMILRTP